MIDISVFSSWITIFAEHYKREFSPTLVKLYHAQLAPKLSTEQFQAACEQILMNEKFFPPLQVFVDYGKGSTALNNRPEYQQFIAPAQEDTEELISNQVRLANMVKSIGRQMPDIADKEDLKGIDPSLRVRCDRLTHAITSAKHQILIAEAIRKAVEFVEANPGQVELVKAHDGFVYGVRPKLAEVVPHAV